MSAPSSDPATVALCRHRSALARGTLGVVALLAVAAVPLSAQLISLRTVPVASGDQFLFLPAQSLGMAGVHLAVDDTLGDPWSQPARGARLEGSTLLSSPTIYGISEDGGSGRTFPVATLLRGERWFGGGAVALQQVDNDAGRTIVLWSRTDPFPGAPPFPDRNRLSDRSERNLFARAFVGRELGEGPWSVGLAGSVAELDAMDGVDLLYAGAQRIEQDGSVADLRLGFFRDGEEDRLALLLVHHRVDMTHDVVFTDLVWPPDPPPDGPFPGPVWVTRTEVNEDKTRTWGVHAAWDRDLAAEGWQLGLAGTINRKSHPKIPNYEIQNIPRDPGTTWAYDLGVGIGRTVDGTTFGLDLHLQPIWSETWQEAVGDEVGPEGRVFEEGERTLENDFFFTNATLRVGLGQRWDRFGVQGGVELRSYDYELTQTDLVDPSTRDQEESWMEWTPTLGLSWRVSELEVAYAGRLTTGTGQPGVTRDLVASPGLEAAGGDFIVAPSGPLTLQDARILTHQIRVRVPIS